MDIEGGEYWLGWGFISQDNYIVNEYRFMEVCFLYRNKFIFEYICYF